MCHTDRQVCVYLSENKWNDEQNGNENRNEIKKNANHAANEKEIVT